MKSNLEIITDALEQSASISNGGVRSSVDPDGNLMTNYVPFRRSEMLRVGMTLAERQHAIDEWRRIQNISVVGV